MKSIEEIDFDNRAKAIAALEKAKEKERKNKLVPLLIGDEDNTIFMVSPKLTLKQREKLRLKKLEQYYRKVVVNEPTKE